MGLKKLYASITKTEEQGDGTIKVWGYASSEAVDSDGETITADAMKAALPDYMKFGAVREMHQPSAAGTAIEANVEDDGRTFFGAHVVDPIAVKKVETGVYKGFSIGGKVTKRDELNKSIIHGIRLVEVSLVDRPANPEAVFTCYKAESLDGDHTDESLEKVSAIDQLAAMLDKGEVTPERLIELAKAADAGKCDDEEHDPAPAKTEEEIKKGMYSVARMADLLQSAAYLAEDAEWESQYEGDGSALPASLRDWVKSGITILQAMAAEESAEMLARLKEQAGELETMELSDKASDIAKAGAKFSAATKAALKGAHEACRAADKALAELGYDKDDEDEADKEDADGIGGTGDLAKVSGELDLAKAELSKVEAERDDLKKRIAEMEAKPAPGKALLKAIAKGEDVGDAVSTAAKELITDAKGDINEAASLIKMIHRGAAR